MSTKSFPDPIPLLDGIAEDTKPARQRGPKVNETPKPSVAYKPGKLVAPLTEMYSFIGLSCMMLDPDIGTAILENAQACAESLDKLAEKNPTVRKVLYGLVETSAWGAVIAAHLPIILAIAGRFMPGLKDIKSMLTFQGNDFDGNPSAA